MPARFPLLLLLLTFLRFQFVMGWCVQYPSAPSHVVSLHLSQETNSLGHESSAMPYQQPPELSTAPLIINIESRQAFIERTGSQPDNELLVLLYYAHYCRKCQRSMVHLKKMASQYQTTNVRFAHMESTRQFSSDELRALGVTKFPYVQIFRQGECVASFAPMPYFDRAVRSAVEEALNRPDWNAFMTQFYAEIKANRDARNAMSESRKLGP